MRSLWRILAQQWLGGDVSEALTGESAILEGLLGERLPMAAFDVRREPQVSRQAMMVTAREPRPDPEIPAEEAARSESPDRCSR